ncbi:hypothetical protein ES332_D03G103500v1 [Gossypium tomentosum]|uniref:Uncharacterized protein n=1 Tax=Gossypium tomentosum TaxID=34277 RepID=A0A5D2LLB3_GOSTO|nr:hypothetical protein ES332_D03G103500v1 [Gossypium tomentosum]
MASLQCQKPVEKTCCPCPQQGHQKQSSGIGHKMSEMASSTFLGHGQTNQCHSQTGTHHTHWQTAQCQGKHKRRGERKRGGLIQKIKDAVDDSSSSSDSESDDEKYGGAGKCQTEKGFN